MDQNPPADRPPQAQATEVQPTHAPPTRRRKFLKSVLEIVAVLAVAWTSDHIYEWLTEEHVLDVRAFNERLKQAVSNFSPAAMADQFGDRLRDDHGWRPFSFRAPFNMTVARHELAQQYPRAARRARSLIDVDALTGKPADAELQRETDAYRDGLARIDGAQLPDWAPDFAETVAGLPDAFFFMVRRIFAGGWLSIGIGVATLLVAALFLNRAPTAIVVLPLLTTLIAWLLFMPIAGAAWVLNWIVELFGGAMTAPETSVITTILSYMPVSWVTQKVAEHRVTDALLKSLHA